MEHSEQQQQQQHAGAQSWILLDSDYQNQLLMRAPSVSPVAGNPFEPPSSPAEDEEEQAREVTPLPALPVPPTSIIPTNRDVRLILELAERSFESMDESSLRSSPVTTTTSNGNHYHHHNSDKYGGRSNPAAFRDLRPEIDVSPKSALPSSPVRNRNSRTYKHPQDDGDEDDEEYDMSFFTSHLLLLLSHAATLMVGYYIGSRVAATSFAASTTSSTSSSSTSSSSSSSSCAHCTTTMGSHLATISSSI